MNKLIQDGAQKVFEAVWRKAPHIPKDIWDIALQAAPDENGMVKLVPLLESRLAVMQYEWAWDDAICAPIADMTG